MQHHKLMTAWWIILIFMVSSVSIVNAFPALPSSFYGTVQQGEANIPNGTLIEALTDGKVVAYSLSETYQGAFVYSLDIPGDNNATDELEGGTPGQSIQFRVGGVLANQTAAWSSGVNQNLDLTLSVGKKLSPPQPTLTPVATQTPISKPTLTPIQLSDNESLEEETANTHNATITSIALPTQTKTEVEQGTTIDNMKESADEGSDSPKFPTKEIIVADSSFEEMGWASDPEVVMRETDHGASEKNNPAICIGLPFLFLLGAVVSRLILRRKHSDEKDLYLL